jgi:hypothetical protein
VSLVARLRGSPRTPVAVFFSITSIGLLVSIILTLVTALNHPPLTVSKAVIRRDGLTASVQVTVHNRSGSTTYCPVVSIAALNRDSLDIERLTATPVESTGSVTPGDTVGFKAVFTHLTQHDYAEQLSGFQGFIKDQRPCDSS